MKIDTYKLRAGDKQFSYEFISEGPKGFIIKRIQFTLIGKEGVYNLAFGDKDLLTGEINDRVVSNNGDSEKVLATIAGAAFAFLGQQPHSWIFASGSTAAEPGFIKWE